MRRFVTSVCFAIALACVFSGCGSYGSSSSTGYNPPPAGSVPVSISIHDNPPANVTILRFELQVTAATLTPMAAGQSPVNMLSSPQEVELEHLQTESAILANSMVPTGTYSGLSATFASPKMTIFNQTGQTINVGMQSCATNQVCMLTPALNMATVSVNAPTMPFPLTLASDSAVALLLHFDINASVQGDLSITPTVSISQFLPGPIAEHEHMHLVGIVSAVSSPTFTLQTGLNGESSVITTDSNTMYDFDTACPAENFSCVMTGQVLRVSVNVMSGGVLEATRVKLFQRQGNPSFTGTITAVNAAQNQFQIVLGDRECQEGQFPEAAEGLSITINLAQGATFTIDSDGLTLPAGVSFASVADLAVGQNVQFQPQPPFTISGTPPNIQISIGASSVQLEPTQVTATVSAVNAAATPANFVLGNLPPLFTGANITMIQVDAVMGTEFDNISGVSALSTGQKVSVSGLLFNTATQPTIVAEDIKLRVPDGDD